MSDLPLKLFLSYSHKDELEKESLTSHLTILKRSGIVSEWHDRLIVPGQDWANEIDTHLDEADIVLLLISASFVASEYCYGIEMKKALERHETGVCLVIPIYLKSCDYQGAPFTKIQGLPKNMKPIVSWNNSDEAWTNVAVGIREACAEWRQTHVPQVKPNSVQKSLRRGYQIARVDPSIYQVAWSPDCQYVATGDNNRQISIWSTDPVEAEFESGSFKLAERIDILEKDSHRGTVRALAWDPTGTRLASSGDDKQILLWDIDFDSKIMQKPTRRLKRHYSAVNSLIWLHPNRLISGADDTEIMIWNPVTGDLLYQFTNDNKRVLCIAVSRDKTLLAVGGDDGVIRIFNWLSQTLDQKLKGHTGEIYSVAWSADGTLASASEDKEIRLWDLDDPENPKILTGHAQEVLSVSFSGDGRLLASQSSDMTLRFWNAVEASPVDLLEWQCSEHPNVGMQFDLAQPLLVSLGKKDHSFRVWEVSVDELLNAAHERTKKDNEAWNRFESGFISTSFYKSSRHRKVRNACEEAGHNPVMLQIKGRFNNEQMREKVLNIAYECDFYLGIFHSAKDCLFADLEIEYFLSHGKKCYFFFPNTLDKNNIEQSPDFLNYETFRDSVSRRYHTYTYDSDDELIDMALRVLKARFATRRSLIQSSEDGLYGNPLKNN